MLKVMTEDDLINQINDWFNIVDKSKNIEELKKALESALCTLHNEHFQKVILCQTLKDNLSERQYKSVIKKSDDRFFQEIGKAINKEVKHG